MRSILMLLALALTAHAAPLARFTSDASGFDTATWWYDTGAEVVVFDAQFTPAHAEAVLAAVRAQTASPVRWLVITHPNPDKFNGAPVFQRAGARVITSRATAAAMPAVHAFKKRFFVDAGMFTEATYPALATVDQTFEGHFELPLSRGRVVLHALPAGVSSAQVVAEIPAERALVVGDLIHHGVHAWLERGDLDGWKATLKELAGFGSWTVHGGRGEPAPVEQAVAAQIAYLDGARDVIANYLTELAPGAQPDYQTITERMAAAFPDHRLAYLITYGSYGLVNALSAR